MAAEVAKNSKEPLVIFKFCFSAANACVKNDEMKLAEEFVSKALKNVEIGSIDHYEAYCLKTSIC